MFTGIEKHCNIKIKEKKMRRKLLAMDIDGTAVRDDYSLGDDNFSDDFACIPVVTPKFLFAFIADMLCCTTIAIIFTSV